MPGLPKSWTEFELYTTCNLIGTQRLAEACHQVGVRRLVHASTSSVYGAQAVGAEDMPKRPVSPYGVTKLAAESLLQAYVQSFDLPVVVLRYFSIYGPRQRPDMAFHIFIERIRRAEAISVYGDGLQSRSFTFVDDCVAGTVAAIERGRLGETYNIGGGEAVTLRRAIELIGATLGTEPKIDHLPSRAGDQRETLADTTKAQRELGYEPSVSMADGLARQVGWHLREMPA
jgi:nucleoside-diphosphate-sugar epimerase